MLSVVVCSPDPRMEGSLHEGGEDRLLELVQPPLLIGKSQVLVRDPVRENKVDNSLDETTG